MDRYSWPEALRMTVVLRPRSRNYMTRQATPGARLEVSTRLVTCTLRRYWAAVRSWLRQAASRISVQQPPRNFSIWRVGLGLKPRALEHLATIALPRLAVTVRCLLRVA